MIDQVARLDADDEEQQELRVAIENPDGHQQPKDAAKAAVERVGVGEQRGRQRARDQIEHQRGRGRAQHRNRIEARDPVRVMKGLEKSGEKPQRQQLEERAERCPRMHKAVGNRLPESAVHE